VTSVAPRRDGAADDRAPEIARERSWAQAHPTVTREHVTRLPIAEGAIPRELRGVSYRNGPARFERGATTYGHLFDGDGMVASFGFDDLGVLYRNRFVRTAAFEDEERAGEVRHRGFGTPVPGGLRANALRARFKNAANTGVVAHAGVLLALWEGGLPHRIDPLTLATLGPYDFDGALLAPRSLSSGMLGRELPFCAHPKRDPATGELVAFGLRMGVRPSLLIHRVDPHGRMKPTAAIRLDALWFVHDFAVTPRWLVFVLCPVAFRVASMLAGRTTPAESLAGDRGRSLRVLAVERASLEGSGKPRTVVATLDASDGDARAAAAKDGFAFHVVNAFERGEDHLEVDVAWTDGFPVIPSPRAQLPSAFVAPRLAHIDVDLPRRRLDVTKARTLLEIPDIDPRFAGRAHGVAWGLGGSTTLSGITRWERDARARTRDFAPDIVAPPLFVPRPGARREGDGWILTTVFVARSQRSELLVLDATTLRTVARAPLPHVLPPHFHGFWARSGAP
jgi:all-trans-8'-apo-beta-carotenal 15,15'-oxygenase